MKAVLKKKLGQLKKGTVLHYSNGVFVHKGHTFFAEDVYFDEVHFEVIEAVSPLTDVIVDSSDTNKSAFIL